MITMEKNKIIRIVELKNKSRKGTYLYIHDKIKNKRSYIKINNDETPLDFYIEYAKINKSKIKNKKQFKKQFLKNINEAITKPKKHKQFIKQHNIKIQKYKKINKIIKKGQIRKKYRITEIQQNPQKIYKEILSPLVLDKQLLNIITKEENVQKYKYRLYYTSEFEGYELKTKEKKRIGTINDFNKTLNEIITKYQKHIKEKMIIPSGYIPKLKNKLNYIKGQQNIGDSLIQQWNIIIEFTKNK